MTGYGICVVYLYLTGFWQAGGGANGRRVTGWGRVGTQQVVEVLHFIHLPMKMELIEGSETSAIRTQTPGNYPKENILHIEHGESLKSRIHFNYLTAPFSSQIN